MNASDQGISLGGLLGTGETAATGAGFTAKKPDNELKNKEFSSVLGAEKERLEAPLDGAASPVAASPRESVPAAAAPVVAVDDAQIRLFFAAEDGKLLPLDGELLPQSELFSLSMDESGNLSLTVDSGETGGETLDREALLNLMGEEWAAIEAALAEANDPVNGDLVPGAEGELVLPGIAMTLDKDGNLVPMPVAATQAGRGPLAQTPIVNGFTPVAVSPAGQGAQAAAAMTPAELVPAASNTAVEVTHRPVSAEWALNNSSANGQAPALANPNLMSALIPAQAGERLSKPSSTSTTALDGTAPVNSNFAATTGLNGAEGSRAQLPVAQAAPIPVEVGKQGWGEQVMQRVMWMSAQNINRAEIALDPPELGPLQVRVSAQGEHMSVSFTSSHGVVRDALDQGLPRLRDLMEQQGLDLVDVDVSDQNLQRQAHRDDADAQQDNGDGLLAGGSASDATGSESGAVESPVASSSVALGLVDHYV